MKKFICSQCGSIQVIIDPYNGEQICSKCGLVLMKNGVDRGAEWQHYKYAEKIRRKRSERIGSYALGDMGLSTVLKGSKDIRGRKLDKQTLQTFFRLRKRDNISKMDENNNRNLSVAIAQLDRMCYELHLSYKIKENAALHYRKALKMDLIRGRSIDAVVAACIYASCREFNIPRSIKTVSIASKRDYLEVAKTYRIILNLLNLKMPIDKPEKYIPGIVSSLGVNQVIEKKAQKIVQKADDLNVLVGKNPRSIAAAAVYMACLDEKMVFNQGRICEASDISEVTLRKRVKEFRDKLISL